MIGSIAPFAKLAPAVGVATRAACPAAESLSAPDDVPARAARHTAYSVAFAPVAMTALIQAQAQMAPDTPVLARQIATRQIDGLLSRLQDAPVPPPAGQEGPMPLRQLAGARDALAASLVDLTA